MRNKSEIKAKSKGQMKVAIVMEEFKDKKLKSSSGRKVTNPKQAIAIALSEGRRVAGKKAKPKKPSPKKATTKKKSKNPKMWIQKAIEHPGALRRELKVKKGKDIPVSKLKKAAKKKGVEGKRARLAITLRSLNKKKKK